MEFNETETQALLSLQQDFRVIGSKLSQLAVAVVEMEVSQYPLFIATDTPISLGLPVDSFVQTIYRYRISHLEELVGKGLVSRAQIPAFREQYPDPRQQACVFLVREEVSRFVFVPYSSLTG